MRDKTKLGSKAPFLPKRLSVRSFTRSLNMGRRIAERWLGRVIDHEAGMAYVNRKEQWK